MPATRFFKMLEAGRKLRAQEQAEACDIAYIPAAEFRYYEAVKNMYRSLLEEPPEIPEYKAPGQAPNVFKAESKEAKVAVMSVFAAAKGKGIL